jgi:hypothetical protein
MLFLQTELKEFLPIQFGEKLCEKKRTLTKDKIFPKDGFRDGKMGWRVDPFTTRNDQQHI